MNELTESPNEGEKPPEKIIRAQYEGTIQLADGALPLNVAVLEDGTRLIGRNEIFRAFGRTKRGRAIGETRAENLPSFIDAKNLQPFISEELYEYLTNPIKCKTIAGPVIDGYNAIALPLICDAYLDAANAGALIKSQEPLAAAAIAIVRSLSKVGIIALIDEATGFIKDKNRAKDELQKFLLQFMREDAAKLVRRFEDSFFEMIYKMRGWTWNYTHKHPGVVGVWINDIVYERLAPLVLAELRRKNPVQESGNRKNKHHQFLSDDVGVPKLLNHIAAVEALGRASGHNWPRFMSLLDTAFPKQHQQLSLMFDEPDNQPQLPHKQQEALSGFDKKLVTAINYNPKGKESK